MIRKRRKQLEEIIDGHKNLLKSRLGLSSEKDLKVFKAREEICNACPLLNIETDKCSLCGCPKKKKTKSLISKCPDGKW